MKSSEIEPGQNLLHYRLDEKIGEGGMGVVWRATDRRLERTVAIKLIRRQLADRPGVSQRFEREARLVSSLNHPHICVLYDVGHHRGIDFFVMEHLEGELLATRLRRGALPLDEALRFGIQISEALDEAHRSGVVHRDLKPGNVMVTPRGTKLMDFGLATSIAPPLENSTASALTTVDQPLTEMGHVIGTLPYMAPEQLKGEEVDSRTDLFALGSLLFEMVTGRRAFEGTSPTALVSAILTRDPPAVSELRPQVPPLLDLLIRRCLAKEPGSRWGSARDLAGELAWIAAADPGGTRRPVLRASEVSGPRIEVIKSPDGAAIAAARIGRGRPLFVVPAMGDTIETSWKTYAAVFPEREIVTYDRRGTGLSERGSIPADPEPYLEDAVAVVDCFELEDLDVLGTLLGTTEAAWLASRRPDLVGRLVLRAPTIGLGDWASIPGVRAALAALEHDWEFFTESFAQFVVGWGSPRGPALAAKFREITSREELRALLQALMKLELIPVYRKIDVPTLVEHHPGYFFPNAYSRTIVSMIAGCQMAVFSGPDDQFLNDLTLARDFLNISSPEK